MLSLLNDNINNGLIFIYGLISIVVVLIIIISIIDRIDNKKRKNKKSLADTLSMKPIREDDFENKDIEVLNMINNKANDSIVDLLKVSDDKIEKEVKESVQEVVPEVKKVDIQTIESVSTVEKVVPIETIEEENIDTNEEEFEYIEDDLEKTQAQIRVEEITRALEQAQIDEKIEHDKYSKFEEEQEKNAFISYDELKNNYDRLYEENEKTQYLEDNTIPINISELYEAAQAEKEAEVLDTNTEVLDDIETLEDDVYSKNNLLEVRTSDTLIRGSSFLNNLKELRDNLD